MSGAVAQWLPDGRRLHLHHGPIDLIVEAFGPEPARRRAYHAATRRFLTVLEELVAELPRLRRPLGSSGSPLKGVIARRMARAVAVHPEAFVTPMAAVAGAVADEVIDVLTDQGECGLSRAYANNGGDIAIWLAPGEQLTAAIVGASSAAKAVIRHQDRARGIATSGWRGRSQSLGIADAVTVTAGSAAAADAAATLIANALDLPGHPKVSRMPAIECDPDSDLGGQEVTVAVGQLVAADIGVALDAGAAVARGMARAGTIESAALFLAGEERVIGMTGVGESGVRDA